MDMREVENVFLLYVEKIKKCLNACTVPCSIKRYHFYDPPVPNGQVIKLVTVSVLQYFLAPIRHRRW